MSANEDHAHESLIKTPKQLVTVVLLAFIVPIIVITLLAQLASSGRIYDKDSPAMSADEVGKRIKPVAEVNTGFGPASKTLKSGEEVYKSVCMACHATGVANAPKFGDRRDWSRRIAKGQRALIRDATRGLGAMPPRGGASDLSDVEFGNAVVYMANAAGAKFTAPASGVAAAAPAAAPAPAARASKAAGPQQAAKAAADGVDGKKVYESTCIACHGTGVANAPKFGDKNAWAPHLALGVKALYNTALKGKGPMPPKGGNLTLSDAHVRAAVDYMVGAVK
jgi:cytochrome c5